MTTFLYRLFNDGDELLYVGISGRVTARIESHLQSKPWRHQIAHMRAVGFPSRDAARKAEREAIRLENPKYNIQHKTPEAVLLHKLQRFWDGLDPQSKVDALAASLKSKPHLNGPKELIELHAATIAMVAQAQGVPCHKIVAGRLPSQP
jgi:predicted GIY-YIG superfamily endonuclease